VSQAALYFNKVAEAEWTRAVQKLDKSADQVDAEMAAQSKLISGAHIKRIEAAISDELKSFGNALRAKLTEYDQEHSPIRPKDFELAKEKISEFRDYCLNFYQHRIQLKYSHYPKSRRIFDGGKLEQPLNDLQLAIEGDLFQFKSRRSFIKWAIGDLRKRFWSAILIASGTVLGPSLNFILEKLTH
jgi:hypothetical protein